MPSTRSNINAVFGAVLKGVAKESGKTQKDVATHLGQDVVTINRIFNGKRDITVTQFFEIADFCGIPASDVLNRVVAKLMSAPPANVIPLKPIQEMTDDEIEQLSSAAVHDPELERDEPEHP